MRKITFLLLICALCPVFALKASTQATLNDVIGQYSGTIAISLKGSPIPTEALDFQVTNTGEDYQLVIPKFPVKSLIVAIVGEAAAGGIIGTLGSETLEYDMPMAGGSAENTFLLHPAALDLKKVMVKVLIDDPVHVTFDPGEEKMSFTLSVPSVELMGSPLDDTMFPIFPITLAVEGTRQGSGLKSLQQDADLAIYPNADGSGLKIASTGVIRDYQIISLNGSLVAAAQVNAVEKQINISNLPVGIYLLKANTENGIVVKKFIRK